MREISAARPVYVAPEENLPHVEFLKTLEACMAHMQRHLDAFDFEKVFLRNARTHETHEIPVESLAKWPTTTADECVIKLTSSCFLYRAIPRTQGFVVIETRPHTNNCA